MLVVLMYYLTMYFDHRLLIPLINGLLSEITANTSIEIRMFQSVDLQLHMPLYAYTAEKSMEQNVQIPVLLYCKYCCVICNLVITAHATMNPYCIICSIPDSVSEYCTSSLYALY